MTRLSTGAFVAAITAADPRLAAVVGEHIDDYDDVLLHLLVADLGRTAEAAHRDGDARLRDTVLDLMAVGLGRGDDAVENAVAVSFVEDADASAPEGYIASWPEALLAERQRQLDWRP